MLNIGSVKFNYFNYAFASFWSYIKINVLKLYKTFFANKYLTSIFYLKGYAVSSC